MIERLTSEEKYFALEGLIKKIDTFITQFRAEQESGIFPEAGAEGAKNLIEAFGAVYLSLFEAFRSGRGGVPAQIVAQVRESLDKKSGRQFWQSIARLSNTSHDSMYMIYMEVRWRPDDALLIKHPDAEKTRLAEECIEDVGKTQRRLSFPQR